MRCSSRARRLALALAALAFLGAPPAARAHQSGVSAVRIDVIEGAVDVELVVKGADVDRALGTAIVYTPTDTVGDGALAAVAAQVADYLLAGAAVVDAEGEPCAVAADAPIADADGVILWSRWTCAGGGAMRYRNRLFIAEDPLAIQNVLVMTGDDVAQDVLTAEHDTLVVSEPPSGLAVFGRYTWSGIKHIFIGYDHIAFLIALMLWARRLWPVVKVVTAFTVAHSITLALAVLDVFAIPAAIVEPMIAATVVWVAAENFFSRDVDRRWRVTFALGLVHGFGFAGVLRAFGLPSESLGLALAAFNVGVEIGQIVIVSIAVPFLLSIDRALGAERRSPPLVNTLSLLIAGLGLYWLAARTILA